MKKLFILLTVISLALQSKAQDKLITQKGDVKIVYNVEVGPSNIFYKLENKENVTLQQIAKKDVVMIIHADGSKELFNTGETSTPKTETPQNLPINASTIDRHPVVVKNGNFVAVQFIDEKVKAKDKKANAFYAVCQLKNGSVMEDDNIKGEYKIIEEMGYNIALQLTLQNKTDKTIYLDLGNTFIMRGGEATAYYIPSATSTGKESSAGGSMNLGGVSNALGVGGAAGNILSGVNVGGGSSKSSTTTTYAQRVIAIPPRSKKTLDDKLLFPVGSEKLYTNVDIWALGKSYIATNLNLKLKEGESLEYNEDNSPVNVSSYTSYSFNEECKETFPLQANFYIKQIIGYRNSKWTAHNFDKLLSSDWKERTYIDFYYMGL